MKRIFCAVLVPILALSFAACSSGSGEDPITAVRPGMILEEVLELEPDLIASDKDGMLHCKRNFGGAEGWFFVNFYTAESGEIALNVGWDAEPQEDGEKVYRELLSGLKSCYGKPTDTAETKASDSNHTAVQTAIWKTEVYLGKLTYSENTDTGACRVLYIAGLESATK